MPRKGSFQTVKGLATGSHTEGASWFLFFQGIGICAGFCGWFAAPCCHPPGSLRQQAISKLVLCKLAIYFLSYLFLGRGGPVPMKLKPAGGTFMMAAR